jgi:hypothetical protein
MINFNGFGAKNNGTYGYKRSGGQKVLSILHQNTDTPHPSHCLTRYNTLSPNYPQSLTPCCALYTLTFLPFVVVFY